MSFRLLAAAVLVAVGAALSGVAVGGAPTASQESHTGFAPPGQLLLGVVGPDPDGFDRLTGKHHVLHVMFAEWAGDVAGLIANEHAAGRLPVLSLPSSLAPADIARGAEDARYVQLSSQLNGSNEDVWVRILPEMNGDWNPWCAYDETGRSRGPKYVPAQFVRAFRRIAIILRGGTTGVLDAKLRAAGLPPLRTERGIQPSGRVMIIWNPQGHGTPYIAANGPQAYWPGAGYADIVADDLYSDSGEPSWEGMETLYAYRKPFLVDEWGLKGRDDVAFATRIFAWVLQHRRTVGVVYYNKGWSGGTDIFELASKPRSLAVYRRAVRNPRFVAALP